MKWHVFLVCVCLKTMDASYDWNCCYAMVFGSGCGCVGGVGVGGVGLLFRSIEHTYHFHFNLIWQILFERNDFGVFLLLLPILAGTWMIVVNVRKTYITLPMYMVKMPSQWKHENCGLIRIVYAVRHACAYAANTTILVLRDINDKQSNFERNENRAFLLLAGSVQTEQMGKKRRENIIKGNTKSKSI